MTSETAIALAAPARKRTARGALLVVGTMLLVVAVAAMSGAVRSAHDAVEVLGSTAGTWLAAAGLACLGAAVGPRGRRHRP